MQTKQINFTVGFRIPYGFGGYVKYEVTECVDMGEADERDQILNDKRIELTTHIYDHAKKMLDRLDRDETARAESKKSHTSKG